MRIDAKWRRRRAKSDGARVGRCDDIGARRTDFREAGQHHAVAADRQVGGSDAGDLNDGQRIDLRFGVADTAFGHRPGNHIGAGEAVGDRFGRARRRDRDQLIGQLGTVEESQLHGVARACRGLDHSRIRRPDILKLVGEWGGRGAVARNSGGRKDLVDTGGGRSFGIGDAGAARANGDRLDHGAGARTSVGKPVGRVARPREPALLL